MNKDDLAYRPCVGAMLVNGEGRVFVAQRIDTPGTAWQMPQGGIDEGEEPRQAVLRELEEEIGTDKAEIVYESADWRHYDLPDELIGKIWGGKYRGQTQIWFLLRFLGKDEDIDISSVKHPEFSDWKWVGIDAVPDLIVPFKRALYQNVVSEFQPLVSKMIADMTNVQKNKG